MSVATGTCDECQTHKRDTVERQLHIFPSGTAICADCAEDALMALAPDRLDYMTEANVAPLA